MLLIERPTPRDPNLAEDRCEAGEDVLHLLILLVAPAVLVRHGWARRYFDPETCQGDYAFGGSFAGIEDLEAFASSVEPHGFDVLLKGREGDRYHLEFLGRYDDGWSW